MVAVGNQRKRAEAERKAEERRDKPMTQAHMRDCMRNFVKNQSSAVYGKGWTMGYVKGFLDAELIIQCERIHSNLRKARIQVNQPLKRPGRTSYKKTEVC